MIKIYYMFLPYYMVENKYKINQIHHKAGRLLLGKCEVDDRQFTNISHSYNLVTCVVSDNPIGIDIEYNKYIDIKEFNRRIFPEFVWENILSSKAPSSIFLENWTLLEAALKASRYALTISLDEVKWFYGKDFLEIRGVLWYYKQIKLDENYKAAIAANKSINEVPILEEIDFYTIENKLIID